MSAVATAALRALGPCGDAHWTAGAPLRHLVASPDGRRLWAVVDGGLLAWDVASGTRVVERAGRYESALAHPSGLLVRSTSAYSRFSYEGNERGPWARWNRPAGTEVVAAGQREVLFAARMNTLRRTDGAGTQAANLPFSRFRVCPSPGGDRALVIGKDRRSYVAFWFNEAGAVAWSRRGTLESSFFDAAVLGDGTCLVAGAGQRLVRAELESGTELWSRPDAGCGWLFPSGDGRFVLLHSPTEARLMRVTDGSVVREFSRNATVDAWVAAPPAKRARTPPRVMDRTCAAVAYDGSWVALEETPGAVQCFDEHGTERVRPRGGRSPATGIAWAPEGRAVMSASACDPAITEWSFEPGEPRASIEHPWSSTGAIYPSPDGRFVLAECVQRSNPAAKEPTRVHLAVLDRASGVVLAELRGPTSAAANETLRWARDASSIAWMRFETGDGSARSQALRVVAVDSWLESLLGRFDDWSARLLDADSDAVLVWSEVLWRVPVRDGARRAISALGCNRNWVHYDHVPLYSDGVMFSVNDNGASPMRGRLCCWETATGRVRWCADFDERSAVAVAPSGHWVVTMARDALRVRATSDGRLLSSLHVRHATSVRLSPRGDGLAWLETGGTIQRVAVDAAALDRAATA